MSTDSLVQRATIDEEINAERQRQDEQWGGVVNDDKNTPIHWTRFIRKQNNFAQSASGEEFRQRMLKIAALAIAAIEAQDRKKESYTVNKNKELLNQQEIEFLTSQMHGIIAEIGKLLVYLEDDKPYPKVGTTLDSIGRLKRWVNTMAAYLKGPFD